MGVTDETMHALEGDITGGLSDRLILFISFVGFGFLGLVLFLFVLSPSSESGDDSEGKPDRSYEEDLDQADVRTLNRSQLRARAKLRMKKTRRLAQDRAEEANVGEDQGQDREPTAIVVVDANIEEDDGEDDSLLVHHISRKARNKAAKSREKKERLFYAEMRLEQTEISQKQRKERAKEERIAKEEAQEEKRKRERAEYDDWNNLFSAEDIVVENETSPQITATVTDFIELVHCSKSKCLKIKDLATRYHVDSCTMVERIRQLQEEGRVTGIVDDEFFILVTDLQNLGDGLSTSQSTTLSDLAKEIESNLKPSP